MKLAIMQPYFFPYLGYFQLIKSIDEFVIFDDVNFIKKGWINRNFILSQREKQLITLPVKRASQNKLINQIETIAENKILRTIEHSYRKAPHFRTIFSILENILANREENLSIFLSDALKDICAYLDLTPKWHFSSELQKDCNLRGQEKILAICKELGASNYVNLSGGKELYNSEDFKSQGIELSFIQMRDVAYSQFVPDQFAANLSIIDVMMFNDRQKCRELLADYELV